jgi:7-carboxy-7-deazaguanine synthase
MSYLVNTVYYTLQGEGVHTGRAAVFCRFARCNLWTGREEDRRTAVCQFCDTDFTASTRYPLGDLVDLIEKSWGGKHKDRMVVFTGGEPALQLDEELVQAVKRRGFYVAVETNGTKPLPKGVNWVCMSPKAGTKIVEKVVDELKLVFPQERLMPFDLDDIVAFARWLSPMDGPNREMNTQLAIDWVLRDTNWCLNVQTHKLIGMP